MSFLAFLLTNWKSVLSSAACAALTMAFTSLAYGTYITHLENKQAAALVAQATTLHAECAKVQQTTMEVSHEYQNQLAGLREQLDAAKRVRPHACYIVRPAQPAAGRDGAPLDAQLPHADAGVDGNDLLDFAYDAEQVGRQLDACQGFVKAERQ